MPAKYLGLMIGLVLLLFNHPVNAEQTLMAPRVDQAPVIDGMDIEPAWSKAPVITVHDLVADIPVQLQAVHDGEQLYIKAHFSDATENRNQKNLVWDKEKQIYVTGPKREDTFVIKWSMEIGEIDLSLSSNDEYKADIWYWKAHRTDSVGYADDKYQLYSARKIKKSARRVSKSGDTFYLLRKGDKGTSSYKKRIVLDYSGDTLLGIENRKPKGSRADVRAKGFWSNGMWTVEFSRLLDTGHDDDVIISADIPAQFGISRYEIAGRQPDPSTEIPNYGSGEIGETLYLQLR